MSSPILLRPYDGGARGWHPVIVMALPWPDGGYVGTDDLQGGRLAAYTG